jgi:hypothetical protein
LVSWVDVADVADEAAFFAADGTRALADLLVDGDPTTSHDPANEIVLLRSR